MTDLGEIQRSALQTMLKLGEVLVEAKRICKTQGGVWSDFLDSAGLKERHAREAIVFFNRRFEIDQMTAEGAQPLTVSAVRRSFAALTGSNGLPSPEAVGPTRPAGPRSRVHQDRARPGEVGGIDLAGEVTTRESADRPGGVDLPSFLVPAERRAGFLRIPPGWPSDHLSAGRDKVVDVRGILLATAQLLDCVTTCLDSGEGLEVIPYVIEGQVELAASMIRLRAAVKRVDPESGQGEIRPRDPNQQ